MNGLSEVVSRGGQGAGELRKELPFRAHEHRPSFEERTGVAEGPLGHREKESFTDGRLTL